MKLLYIYYLNDKERWYNSNEYYYIYKDCNRWIFEVNEWKIV